MILCSSLCRTLCHINANMSKVWKQNKLQKRIFLCFISACWGENNILLLTKAFKFPFHTCLGQRSHLNNKNHLICYLAVRQVAEQNINYPIIYWQSANNNSNRHLSFDYLKLNYMSNWNESAGPRYLFVATNLLQNKWGLGKLHDHK